MSSSRYSLLFIFILLALLAAILPAGAKTIICIDPGHPSEVGRGTQGRHMTEIHAAWLIAQDLKTTLEADGYGVVVTKQSENEFLTNRNRAEIANAAGAKLFIRLHCDADAGTGIATFYPDQPGLADGVRGPSAEVIAQSRVAALAFQGALIKTLHGALANRGVKPDTATRVGGKQGALTGSVFAHEPVFLVEMCVLTNPKDEAFIASQAGQRLLTQAIAGGIIAAIRQIHRIK